MRRYDAIVVGAGTGGCMVAKTVADAGLDVCLIDRKREEDIGDKVCGDSVGKHHFDRLGLEYPASEELEQRVEGIKVYSPSMETVFYIKGEGLHGFSLNRHSFGQRLLRRAIDAGATLMESTHALEPLMEGGFVNGVLARDTTHRTKVRLYGKVVVDASGFSAVLRSKLPPEIGVETRVENEDVEACFREVRQLKEHLQEPGFCEIYLDQAVAPDGYHWIFPKGETKVNVGLGVVMVKGFPNPRNRLYQGVLPRPLFRGSTVLDSGAWYVPTRRPLDSMVGNGFLVVGDAACQANPISGGGIGPSMVGGTLAGKAVAEALEKGAASRESLWSYNVSYMESYGVKQARLDVFRLFLLHGVDNEDIDYGMKYQLITQEDVLKTNMGEDLRLNITETTTRAFKGLRRLSLLRRLHHTANLMKRIKALYRNYPSSPQGLKEWKEEAERLIEEAKLKLKKR